MAAFRFRLQSLLRLREADRDRCREQLAAAYRADQLLVQRQESVRQEIDQNTELVRSRSQPGLVPIDGLLLSHRYELLLQAQWRQLATQRQQVGIEIERRRQALVEADRELRVLEKLRERHAAQYQATQERHAVRELDEMALRRYRQGSGGGSP
jgi:flagellar FliJ protein